MAFDKTMVLIIYSEYIESSRLTPSWVQKYGYRRTTATKTLSLHLGRRLNSCVSNKPTPFRRRDDKNLGETVIPTTPSSLLQKQVQYTQFYSACWRIFHAFFVVCRLFSKLTRIVFLRKNRCLPPFDVKSISH